MLFDPWFVAGTTAVVHMSGGPARPEFLQTMRQLVSCDDFNAIRGVILLVPEVAPIDADREIPLDLLGHLAGMRARLGRVPVAVVMLCPGQVEAMRVILGVAGQIATQVRLVESPDEALRWLRTHGAAGHA